SRPRWWCEARADPRPPRGHATARRGSAGAERTATMPSLRRQAARRGLALAAALTLAACVPGRQHLRAGPRDGAPRRGAPTPAEQPAFLDTLERRTFQWFWDLSDARTGLTPDRWPTHSFVSVGAVGFALTAYPIGVERGWVSRPAAAARVLATLE